MTRVFKTLCALIASASLAQAIEIRGYNKDIHKWLKDIPGEWLYGHAPYQNPKFQPVSAKKLLGVGWPEDPKDWTRQFALVSPIHILYASHYTINPEWKINYLGTDGRVTSYGIAKQSVVRDSKGQPTDLLLITLSSPVTALGVKPFKVLMLSKESDYKNRQILVCGSFVDAATSRIDGFTTLKNDPGFDTTRFIYFDYRRTAKNDAAHGCAITPGDSGGPVFAGDKGELALVGIISSYDYLSNQGIRSYASSVPSYANQIDALMATDGYRLMRVKSATQTVTQPFLPPRR